MRFLKLDISTFLSFGTDELDLANQGIVLIEGENRDEPTAKSNGSGKSAIIEAVVWCLFGVTLRGYDGDEVVNRRIGKDCVVSLLMRDPVTKEKFVVQRARKHSVHKNTLRLWVHDGSGEIDITCPSIAETQAKIETLLHMTLTTFLNSVVFGQSAAYRFSLLTDKQQKEVFDDALGLAQYVAARELAVEESRELRSEVTSLEHTIERQREAVNTRITSREKLEYDARTFEAEKDTRLREIREDLHQTRGTIGDLKERLTALAPGDPDDAEEATGKARLAHADALWKVGEADVRYQVAFEARAAVQNRLRRAKKLGVGSCDLCGQDVTESHRDAHVAELEKQSREAEAAVIAAEDGMADAKALAEKRERKVKAADDVLATIRKVDTEREKLTLRLIAARKERDRLKTEYTRIGTEASPHDKLLADIDAEIKTLNTELDEDELVLAEKERKLKLYDFWIEAFGQKGLRSLLIDTALPLLNEKAAQFAQVLTDGNITIEFKTQSELKSGKTVERFEVAVENKHGAGTYRGHSAGERAKVDLCVGLALQALVMSRLASQVNVSFWDEPFEHLDDIAVDRVAMLLQDVTGKQESTFIITHSDALKTYFPTSWVVVKEHGQSYVV